MIAIQQRGSKWATWPLGEERHTRVFDTYQEALEDKLVRENNPGTYQHTRCFFDGAGICFSVNHGDPAHESSYHWLPFGYEALYQHKSELDRYNAELVRVPTVTE